MPKAGAEAMGEPVMRLEDYTQPTLPIERADEIEFSETDLHEIVEDVFGARRMSVTYGESNSGKTTLMLDLALRMPTGREWLGKRVEPSAVIYIAAESPNSVRLRLEAFRRHHGAPIGEFAMVPSALNFLDPSADVEDLIDLINVEKKRLTLPLRWICVDTVARVMAGADENAGSDMSRLVATCDRLREVVGAHVNLIHHSGKDAAKGARGHSSLRAAVDTEIEVTFDPSTKLHTLEVTKQRDLSSKGAKMSARFLPVKLGTNQWGKPITACVVEPDQPASSHIRAVMAAVDNKNAEAATLAGFRRLTEQGVQASDARNAADFLPKQMLAKGLDGGFSKDQIEAAMNRMMTNGTLKRAPIGHYSNRTPRFGLVCTK